jgi:hypothetical protein
MRFLQGALYEFRTLRDLGGTNAGSGESQG